MGDNQSPKRSGCNTAPATRRNVLRGISAAGVGSVIGLSGTEPVSATQTDIGTALFAEFGIRYKTDVQHTGGTCQMSLYTPDPENRMLRFSAITESWEKIFKNNNAVVKHREIHPLPVHIKGNQSNYVATQTNYRLDPTTDIRLRNPTTTPSARLTLDGSDVILRAQGETLRVGIGESKELELAATQARPRHLPETARMLPVLQVNNYGELDVTASAVVESDDQ